MKQSCRRLRRNIETGRFRSRLLNNYSTWLRQLKPVFPHMEAILTGSTLSTHYLTSFSLFLCWSCMHFGMLHWEIDSAKTCEKGPRTRSPPTHAAANDFRCRFEHSPKTAVITHTTDSRVPPGSALRHRQSGSDPHRAAMAPRMTHTTVLRRPHRTRCCNPST